jgi:hypothetical protein
LPDYPSRSGKLVQEIEKNANLIDAERMSGLLTIAKRRVRYKEGTGRIDGKNGEIEIHFGHFGVRENVSQKIRLGYFPEEPLLIELVEFVIEDSPFRIEFGHSLSPFTSWRFAGQVP